MRLPQMGDRRMLQARGGLDCAGCRRADNRRPAFRSPHWQGLKSKPSLPTMRASSHGLEFKFVFHAVDHIDNPKEGLVRNICIQTKTMRARREDKGLVGQGAGGSRILYRYAWIRWFLASNDGDISTIKFDQNRSHVAPVPRI